MLSLLGQHHHRLHQLLEDAASEPPMMSCNASVRPQETDGAQPRHNGPGSASLSSGDPASADFRDPFGSHVAEVMAERPRLLEEAGWQQKRRTKEPLEPNLEQLSATGITSACIQPGFSNGAEETSPAAPAPSSGWTWAAALPQLPRKKSVCRLMSAFVGLWVTSAFHSEGLLRLSRSEIPGIDLPLQSFRPHRCWNQFYVR